ncbi:Aquaporin-7 [Rhizina undulata]
MSIPNSDIGLPMHTQDVRPGTFQRTMSTMSRITGPNRLPWTEWMNPTIKNHFIACLGEYVGTTLFLFFAFAGTMVASTVNGSNPTNAGTLLYISLAFGFSLAVNVWVFYRVSGGLFNPAVTLAMVAVGNMPAFRACWIFIAQILGGITAAALADVLFPTPLAVSTGLSVGTSVPQGVFIEMFLTAELVFTIFMLAAEKHRGTFMAPLGIGLSLFIAELTGVYYTGGSLNPARSFGPCVVARSFDSNHWIYWVGPALGSLVAAAFYKFIKVLEYETANPGQDAPEHDYFSQVMSNPGSVGSPAALFNGAQPMAVVSPGGRAVAVSNGSGSEGK